MKKMSQILSHLKNNPEFRKINTQNVIQNLLNSLPPKLKKGVKFAYIKREILYFVLTHPVYKMEFEYNKAEIKSILKKAELPNITDLKFFVTNKIEKKKNNVFKNQSYKERSYGIFSNEIKNEKLHNIVEDIRKIIKNP